MPSEGWASMNLRAANKDMDARIKSAHDGYTEIVR